MVSVGRGIKDNLVPYTGTRFHIQYSYSYIHTYSIYVSFLFKQKIHKSGLLHQKNIILFEVQHLTIYSYYDLSRLKYLAV